MVGRPSRMVQLPRSVVHGGTGELLRAHDAAGEESGRLSPDHGHVPARADGKEQGRRRADGCRPGNSRNAALIISLPERIRRDQLWAWSMVVPYVAHYAQRCCKTGEEVRRRGYGRTLRARITQG